jgi:hemerythrin
MVWQDIYSVDIREIDDQHKNLIGMINELHEAMKSGKGREVVSGILKKMIEYASTHFGTEEKYMNEFAFPGYSQHKAEHEAFAIKVVDFQQKYNNGSLALTFEVMDFLEKWLVKHIQGTDKKYVPFFHSKGLK